MFEVQGASRSQADGLIADRDMYHSWGPEGEGEVGVILEDQFAILVAKIQACLE